MAVEIREITIKTEVRTELRSQQQEQTSERDLKMLREQLMEECRRLIEQRTRKKQYKR